MLYNIDFKMMCRISCFASRTLLLSFFETPFFQLQKKLRRRRFSQVTCLGIVSSFSASILEKRRNKFFFSKKLWAIDCLLLLLKKNWGFFSFSLIDWGLYSGHLIDLPLPFVKTVFRGTLYPLRRLFWILQVSKSNSSQPFLLSRPLKL